MIRLVKLIRFFFFRILYRSVERKRENGLKKKKRVIYGEKSYKEELVMVIVKL